MASRLSANGHAKVAGIAGLLIENPGDHRDLIDIDVEKLVAGQLSGQTIREMPPQVLYHAIRRRGVEGSKELLRFVTTEQLTRFLDYDVWPKDEMEPSKVFEWLLACSEDNYESLAKRFSDLEEEYQIALLQGKIRLVMSDELDELSTEEQNNLRPLPGEEMFYTPQSGSPELDFSIVQLVESLIASNVKYAIAVLNHACWAVPNEPENLLSQFRRARLEEDGFVSYEESLAVFARIPRRQRCGTLGHEDSASKIQSDQQSIESVSSDDLRPYFERLISYGLEHQLLSSDKATEMQSHFLYLGNCLASATRVEPDDLNSLGFLVKIASAYTGLACDVESNGQLDRGLILLTEGVPKSLFRVGLQTIYEKQQEVLLAWAAIDCDFSTRLERLWRGYRWTTLQKRIENYFSGRLAQAEIEVLVGFFAQFPLTPRRSSSPDGRLYFSPIGSIQDLTFCVAQIQRILSDYQQQVAEEG